MTKKRHKKTFKKERLQNGHKEYEKYRKITKKKIATRKTL